MNPELPAQTTAEALAEHHQVDRVPELNASTAGRLISKWAGSLPREVRQQLGNQ